MLSVVLAGGFLLALAVPALQLRMATPGPDTFPRSLTVVKTYDNMQMVANLTPPPRAFVQDLAKVSDGALLEVPFSDPFTLPTLNPQAAWTAIKSRYGLTDSSIDGVAVYQTFYSDIIFYAGAYETTGNPQVSKARDPSTSSGQASGTLPVFPLSTHSAIELAPLRPFICSLCGAYAR